MATLSAGAYFYRLRKHGILCLGIALGIALGTFAASTTTAATIIVKGVKHRELVAKFYELNDQELFWLKPGSEGIEKILALQQLLDSSRFVGLDGTNYAGRDFLRKYTGSDASKLSGEELLRADMQITAVAISFFKDMYHGASMNKWIGYDEISARYQDEDDKLLLLGLQRTNGKAGILEFAGSMEPGSEAYATLKYDLARQLNGGDSSKVKQLSTTLNYLRWLNHLHLHELVLINIGSGTISYFKSGALSLRMKAIFGAPEKQTPRFASYCSELILYPYWDVPRSTAVNELLPQFKKSPALVSFLNMEILDAKGRVVNPDKVAWKTLSGSNFPYRFREKIGCVNPMGVVKFNITDPNNVYLKSTHKDAFLTKSKFSSFGRIRVEDPVALANSLSLEPVDAAFLKTCYNNLKPVTLRLQVPVPVIVVYMSAEVDEAGTVQYFQDQYNLLR